MTSILIVDSNVALLRNRYNGGLSAFIEYFVVESDNLKLSEDTYVKSSRKELAEFDDTGTDDEESSQSVLGSESA
jgi:hypothetical protein